MQSGNFFNVIRAAADARPDRIALSAPGGDLRYGDLMTRARRYAGALTAAGAEPGDRILVQTEKSVANAALYLGALAAGLTYTPLNTAYTEAELAYFMADADPAVIVASPAVATRLRRQASAEKPRIFSLDADGAGDIADLAAATTPADAATRDAEDIAVILYTSGTTGRSKGAMLSHRALQANAAALIDAWKITPADVLLHALPIFHIHGLFVGLHTMLAAGAEIIFRPNFSAADIIDHLPRATMMMGVPTFYTRLLETPAFTAEATAHMRLFVSGSAPLTPQTHAAFAGRTGHAILERYGMSEAGMIASNPLDGARVAGTVGYPLPGVSIRIAGGAGEGEIEIAGDSLFSGYWRNPEKTREAMTADGWFRTGDIGAMDADGRLSIIGRDKDLIIVGGYNVYPKEIEAILDSVDGVRESAVVGAPHADMGEGVVAVLVGDPAVADDGKLGSAMAALARFKRPRRFFWIDALPRNAMGKVQKHALRERYAAAFTE